MTVCIAAICDDGRSCVVAADRMGQHGGDNASIAFTREGTASKIVKISDRALLLHSGLKEISDALQPRLANLSEAEPPNKQLDRAISEAIREFRDREIRHFLGEDWNYERLCSEVGTASSGAHYELWRKATYLDVGQVLTVTSAGGLISLHFTSNAQPSRKVGLPYLAVGSGSNDALTALKVQEYDKSATLEQCLLHVACAKRAAEFSYGVDGNTDMVVMTGAGVQEIPKSAVEILTDMRKARFHFRMNESEAETIRASISVRTDSDHAGPAV